MNPFECILAVEGGKAVAEPVPCHLRKKRALAKPLPPDEHGHIVIFASGVHRPRDSGNEGLAADGSRIWFIHGTQIIVKECIQTRCTVPRQSLKVLRYGVESILLGSKLNCAENLILACDIETVFQIPLHASVVVIRPHALFV